VANKSTKKKETKKVVKKNNVTKDAKKVVKKVTEKASETKKDLKKKKCSFKAWWIIGLLLPPVGILLYFLWKNTRKEDARSVGIISLIFLFVWLFFILSFVINSEVKPQLTTVNEIDTSLASEKLQTWYNELDNGNTVVTVIASSTCQYCQALKPIITESSNENNFTLYFFEADQLSDEDYTILTSAIDLNDYEGSIPYTFVVKNREFNGSHTGSMEKEELLSFLYETEVLEN
jgi:thiol-disulfide isomerase/thioredoxin